jgi:hypothetical protein
VPKIVATNTSAEYWRGDCSLIHTDSEGRRDVELPDFARTYFFAGTQHGAGAVAAARGGSRIPAAAGSSASTSTTTGRSCARRSSISTAG